jgi:hypothetical protein
MSMDKINGDTEVYTFEYIVSQQDFPKAYGRKFVVLEKYQELLSDMQVMCRYAEIGAGAVDEEMADEIIAKYKEKA